MRILFLFILLLPFQANAIDFRTLFGMNVATMKSSGQTHWPGQSPGGSLSSRNGFQLGLGFNLGLGESNWHLASDLMYQHKGFTFSTLPSSRGQLGNPFGEKNTEEAQEYEVTALLEYLTLPLMLRYTAFRYLTFGGGIYYGLLLDGVKFESEKGEKYYQRPGQQGFRRSDFGMILSLSTTIRIGEAASFIADLRYGHGWTPIYQSLHGKLYNRTGEFMAGVLF